MNHESTIHAFLTFIDFFVVKVSYEPHNQKDFSFAFFIVSKD